MSELPAGTVTFLFTDVEGSTRLLRELGEDYAQALGEHRRALRDAVDAHGGVEVDTQGDAFFIAFRSAAAAVAAAAEAQRTLQAGRLRVRMGIHTGEPTVTADGYVGLDVHKAARIAAASHGGQIVLSQETRAHLDETITVLDLGEHRVKDFEEPVWLYQVGTETFPPLKTIGNTNLPRPASSFVGRQQEVGAIAALVQAGSRLVTLTGPGGSGKTRVAIEAAAGLVPEFRAGVFWIGLAPIRDAGLVTEAIGQTLGVKDGLAAGIGERELLLLLDNFEHVVDAAPEVSRLLEACPNLHVLVTSRQLLRVRGEVEYPVLPLVAQEAVELFCARARMSPDPSVADLCDALDNLPLAVELAAARAAVLSPAQIVERLSQRLDLFKGGRDADPRQQTLRATIEWSFQLLTAKEQHLFRALAVFAGGCTLEAAEQVAGADLDTLQALVEKSLLRRTDERFWMLETIREYAHEQLESSGEADQLRRRHAEHYLALAERVEPELARERQADWLERLEQDYANLRTSLGWSLESEDPELGLRLAGAIQGFWFRRGYLGEGRRWLADVLARSEPRSRAYAKALFAAALLTTLQGDWPESIRLSAACRELSLKVGEPTIAAESMLTQGRAMLAEGDREGAVVLFGEAAALGRTADAHWVVAMASFNLGYHALTIGEYSRAWEEFTAARNGFDALEDRYGVARSLAGLGSVALHEDRADVALSLLRGSLELSQLLEDRDDIAWALELMGAAVSGSQCERATRLLGAAEALRETLGISLEGVELALHEQTVAALHSMLGADVFAAAWAVGRDLSLEQALDEALAVA